MKLVTEYWLQTDMVTTNGYKMTGEAIPFDNPETNVDNDGLSVIIQSISFDQNHENFKYLNGRKLRITIETINEPWRDRETYK